MELAPFPQFVWPAKLQAFGFAFHHASGIGAVAGIGYGFKGNLHTLPGVDVVEILKIGTTQWISLFKKIVLLNPFISGGGSFDEGG